MEFCSININWLFLDYDKVLGCCQEVYEDVCGMKLRAIDVEEEKQL